MQSESNFKSFIFFILKKSDVEVWPNGKLPTATKPNIYQWPTWLKTVICISKADKCLELETSKCLCRGSWSSLKASLNQHSCNCYNGVSIIKKRLWKATWLKQIELKNFLYPKVVGAIIMAKSSEEGAAAKLRTGVGRLWFKSLHCRVSFKATLLLIISIHVWDLLSDCTFALHVRDVTWAQ